jgi:hypothetical protein
MFFLIYLWLLLLLFVFALADLRAYSSGYIHISRFLLFGARAARRASAARRAARPGSPRLAHCRPRPFLWPGT